MLGNADIKSFLIKKAEELESRKQFKKIWEVEEINLNDVKEITEETRTFERDGEQVEVTIPYFIMKNGEKLEARNSIVKELGLLLKSGINVISFKVIKAGTGINTTYKVIPIKTEVIEEVKPMLAEKENIEIEKII